MRQWYGGPVRDSQPGNAVAPNVELLVPPVTADGVVQWGWGGAMARPPDPVAPDWSLACDPRSAMLPAMTLVASPRTDERFGTLVGNTVLGALLAAAGLVTAYLSLATPFVAWLVPGATATGRQMPVGLGAWSLALIAAGALLFAGTNRLARLLAGIRSDRTHGSAARALALISEDVVVLRDVLGETGRPIPVLVVGPFGLAVINELPPARYLRRSDSGWEARRGPDWHAVEGPVGATIRDAERVRLWLAGADLDFVVRVHSAIVATDQTIERVPGCAVISPAEIPAWVAALPAQRTLTAARRNRVVSIARSDPRMTRGDVSGGW